MNLFFMSHTHSLWAVGQQELLYAKVKFVSEPLRLWEMCGTTVHNRLFSRL